jgi:hypothetical protein
VIASSTSSCVTPEMVSFGMTTMSQRTDPNASVEAFAQIAANRFDRLAGFYSNSRRQTDLNQAEARLPARFFASSGPATQKSSQAGKTERTIS